MTTKYQVEFHGHTFTRATRNRIYTHCVLRVVNIAEWRVREELSARKRYMENLTMMQRRAVADWPGAEHLLSKETRDKMQEQAQRFTAEGTGVDNYLAEVLGNHDRWIEQGTLKTTDGTGAIFCDGWCGRLDLAQRLASQLPGCHILPAVTVEPKRKQAAREVQS